MATDSIYIENLQVGTINVGLSINQSRKIVYLDVNGDDNNDGSQDSPVRTFAKAAELTATQFSSAIIISEGLFEVPATTLTTYDFVIAGVQNVIQSVTYVSDINEVGSSTILTVAETLVPGALVGKLCRTRPDDADPTVINPFYYPILENTTNTIRLAGNLNDTGIFDITEPATTLNISSLTINSQRNNFFLLNCRVNITNFVFFSDSEAQIYGSIITGNRVQFDYGNAQIKASIYNAGNIDASNETTLRISRAQILDVPQIISRTGILQITDGAVIQGNCRMRLKDCQVEGRRFRTENGVRFELQGGTFSIADVSLGTTSTTILNARNTEIYLFDFACEIIHDSNQPAITLFHGCSLDIAVPFDITSNNANCPSIVQSESSNITISSNVNIIGLAQRLFNMNVSSLRCNVGNLDATAASFSQSPVVSLTMSNLEVVNYNLTIPGNTGSLIESNSSRIGIYNSNVIILGSNIGFNLLDSSDLTVNNSSSLQITALDTSISAKNNCRVNIDGSITLNSDVGILLNHLCKLVIDENASIQFTTTIEDFRILEFSGACVDSSSTITPGSDNSTIGSITGLTSTLIGTPNTSYNDGLSNQNCVFRYTA